MKSVTQASSPPLPFGERASCRDLARMRKSHGGKGEGAKASEIRTRRIPLTRSEAESFAATSPQRGEEWPGAS
jgi:hypothetical protein